MAKDSNLSSDLSLIKELEELRIKQKLLVETLSKKDKESHNEVLAHINGKLDFLVKIFQEANAPKQEQNPESDSEKNSQTESNSHQDILEKLDSIEESFNSKFDELSEKIEKLNLTQSNSFDNSNTVENSSEQQTPSTLPSQTTNSENSNSQLPPVPDFTSEPILEDNSSIPTPTPTPENSNSEKKEKKKWF